MIGPKPLIWIQDLFRGIPENVKGRHRTDAKTIEIPMAGSQGRRKGENQLHGEHDYSAGRHPAQVYLILMVTNIFFCYPK